MNVVFLGLFVGVICLDICDAFGRRNLYNGYQVLSVVPATKEQLDHVYRLSQNNDQLDFWMDARRIGDEAQIMVPPAQRYNLHNFLQSRGMQVKTVIKDVESLVSKEMDAIQNRRNQRLGDFDYNDFHTYDEIIDEMNAMVTRCPTHLGIKCETYVIGQSYEGRDQKVLRVYKDQPYRRAYWMDSQIHAREWLAVATNLKFANHMITKYDSDTDARMMLDDGDWHFLFVHNPDGYVYTWTDERMWRKNRFNNTETVPGTICIGVDLNRNYEYKWGNAGTSNDPCSTIYRGEGPADQVEVQNVQTEIRRLAPHLKAFVSIHTAARLILMPWGSLVDPADTSVCEYLEEPEQSEVDYVAKLMAEKIQNTFGYSTWKGGNTCEVIYPASGSTQDYARGVGGVKYSFTPELRNEDSDGNVYGFVPPASEIQPSFEEMLNGFITMVNAINGKCVLLNC